MEDPTGMDDLEVPRFMDTPILLDNHQSDRFWVSATATTILLNSHLPEYQIFPPEITGWYWIYSFMRSVERVSKGGWDCFKDLFKSGRSELVKHGGF